MMKRHIDWKDFIEKAKEYDARGRPGYTETAEKLLDEGILSLDMKNNYQLTACGVIVSPRLRMSILYFARDSDALEYTRAKYQNALYEVEISKVEKIFIPKRRR